MDRTNPSDARTAAARKPIDRTMLAELTAKMPRQKQDAKALMREMRDGDHY